MSFWLPKFLVACGTVACLQNAAGYAVQTPADKIPATVDESNYQIVLRCIYEDALTPQQERDLLSPLLQTYLEIGDSAILTAVAQLGNKRAACMEAVVPEIARMLEQAASERSFCDIYDMLLKFDCLPAALAKVVEKRFDDYLRNPVDFAAIKCAAVLLKFNSDTKSQTWLNQILQHKNRYMRMAAAEALGTVGQKAKVSASLLAQLLRDKSQAVRVVAATSIWRVREDSSDVVPALTAALTQSDEAVVFRPQGISSSGVSHRHVAVWYLGRMKITTPTVLAHLTSLADDEDPLLRLLVVKSLARIDHRSELVRGALRHFKDDANGAVRAEAANVLRRWRH